jgi:serine/threonine protein phosphatase 1
MTSTVYAIGDVHGRADLLSSLVNFISEHARSNGVEPRVFFLGDIVDRGPDSREAMETVCETLRRWPESRLLLGNHDLLFLYAMTNQRYLEKWFKDLGGVKTLAS